MTIEYIRYKIPSEMQQAFRGAIKEANQFLETAPECLKYELSQCTEDNTLFIWRIVWESVEQHINQFRKSTGFPAFFAIVKPFFNDILEMKHYEIVE